jgi:mycoredoxin
MERLTVYVTTRCGWCRHLATGLTEGGIPFRAVDIDRDAAAAAFVAAVNDGNRTVPTVVFPDGTTAANPSIDEVRDRLRVQALR